MTAIDWKNGDDRFGITARPQSGQADSALALAGPQGRQLLNLQHQLEIYRANKRIDQR